MNLDLIKQLRKAGFKPTKQRFAGNIIDGEEYPTVTLSRLIEACGEKFGSLNLAVSKDADGHRFWRAIELDKFGGHLGSTPEEAVAKLWLALKESKSL